MKNIIFLMLIAVSAQAQVVIDTVKTSDAVNTGRMKWNYNDRNLRDGINTQITSITRIQDSLALHRLQINAHYSSLASHRIRISALEAGSGDRIAGGKTTVGADADSVLVTIFGVSVRAFTNEKALRAGAP